MTEHAGGGRTRLKKDPQLLVAGPDIGDPRPIDRYADAPPLGQKSPNEMLAWYDKRLMGAPKDLGLWFAKSTYLVEIGRYQDAIGCYDAILEMDNGHRKALHAKVSLLKQMGRVKEAIATMDQLLEQEKDDPQNWIMKGGLLLTIMDFERAFDCYERALKLDEHCIDAWCGRGEALKRMDEYTDLLDIKSQPSIDVKTKTLSSYEKLTEIAPKFPIGWNGKGDVFLRMGNYEKAISNYDKAIECASNMPQPWYGKGLALRKLGRDEGSMEALKRAAEMDIPPEYVEHVESWLAKGQALDLLERPDMSLYCYEKILELDINHQIASMKKAEVLARLGRDKEALEEYNRAIEIQPRNPLAWFGKGNVSRQFARNDVALTCFNKAVEISPGFEGALYERGCLLLEEGDLEGAVASLDRVLEVNPENRLAREALSRALAGKRIYGGRRSTMGCRIDETGHRSPSRRQFAGPGPREVKSTGKLDQPDRPKAAVEGEDDACWEKRGEALCIEEHYGEAVTCFDMALGINPLNKTAWVKRGVALTRAGMNTDAIASYDRALGIDPMDDEVYRLKAELLYLVGDLMEAVAVIQHSLSIDPSNEGVRAERFDREMRRLLGAFENESEQGPGNPPADEEITERFLSILENEDSPPTIGRGRDALERLAQIDEAVERDPNDKDLWLERFKIQEGQGNYESAMGSLNAVIRMDPSNPRYWLLKGHLALKMGEDEKAGRWYKRTLALSVGQHRTSDQSGMDWDKEVGRILFDDKEEMKEPLSFLCQICGVSVQIYQSTCEGCGEHYVEKEYIGDFFNGSYLFERLAELVDTKGVVFIFLDAEDSSLRYMVREGDYEDSNIIEVDLTKLAW